MNYDVDYFIDKFQRIPEELWITGSYCGDGRGCAFVHCGIDWRKGIVNPGKPEAQALCDLFSVALEQSVITINDGADSRYQQPTPKQRILAALRDIKAKQEAEKPKADVIVGGPEVETPKPKERIVYVTVDAAVRELQQTIGEN